MSQPGIIDDQFVIAAARATQAASSVQSHAAAAVADAIEAGRALIAIRGAMPEQREWNAWIAANWRGERSSLSMFISLASHADHPAVLQARSLSEAMRSVSRLRRQESLPNNPPEAGGISCPDCHCVVRTVWRTRSAPGAVKRERKCPNCGGLLLTRESLVRKVDRPDRSGQ